MAHRRTKRVMHRLRATSPNASNRSQRESWRRWNSINAQRIHLNMKLKLAQPKFIRKICSKRTKSISRINCRKSMGTTVMIAIISKTLVWRSRTTIAPSFRKRKFWTFSNIKRPAFFTPCCRWFSATLPPWPAVIHAVRYKCWHWFERSCRTLPHWINAMEQRSNRWMKRRPLNSMAASMVPIIAIILVSPKPMRGILWWPHRIHQHQTVIWSPQAIIIALLKASIHISRHRSIVTRELQQSKRLT